MIEIKINDNFITLGQLIKLANLIQSGGEIKFFLMDHAIFVNDEPEKRRGKKIYPGHIVRIKGIDEIKVVK